MSSRRFTGQQIADVLLVARSDSVAQAAARHGVSQQTIYQWRKRFEGLLADEIKAAIELERKNQLLAKALRQREAELVLLKNIEARKWRAFPPPQEQGTPTHE